MSILGEELVGGARVLDLFAGQWRARVWRRSRAARRTATFVELNAPSLDALRANIAALGVEGRVTVHRGDALRFAGKLGPEAFDIAFADPPYATMRPTRLVALFRRTPFARILSVEHPGRPAVEGDETRRYGDTALTFCHRTMTRIAIYPGSFDPPTKGHEDLIRRSLALADRVIVAVAVNVRQAAALHGRGAARHAAGRRSGTSRGSPSSRSTACWPTSPSASAPVDHRPRSPRGQRLRIRVPDGAHEPAAASLARDRLPGAGAWT